MSPARYLSTGAARVSIGCGLLSLAALVALPLVDETRRTVPGLSEPTWWVAAIGVLVQALALTRAGDRPRAALVAVALPIPVVALAGAEDATSVTSLAIIVAVYLAATTTSVRVLAGPLAVTASCMAFGANIVATDLGAPAVQALGASVVQALGTLGISLLAGTWIGALRESSLARAGQEEAMAREQSALVRAAIASERTDMARELHDIAAHHLTGIAVLAAAVERQIDTDPAGAKVAVHQVRTQSTMVLRDLRSLVGLLRDRDTAPDARTESLAGIPDLVEEVAAAGRDVTVVVLGDPPTAQEVGPLAQLAAFRAVQEALANAGRHAPGAPCRVIVDARPTDSVDVTIENDPPPGPKALSVRGGGFGLLGMRERAQLTHSDLTAGPSDSGGWQVTMRLPKESETS